MNAPAKVTIIDSSGNTIECKGRYYGNGKILCVHEGQRLLVDPEWYHPGDPLRLMIYGESKWSQYRVYSVFVL